MAAFKANKTFYRSFDGRVMAEGDPTFDHGHLLVREGMEIEDSEFAIWPDGPELLKQMKALNSETKAVAAPEENKAIEAPAENKSAVRRGRSVE